MAATGLAGLRRDRKTITRSATQRGHFCGTKLTPGLGQPLFTRSPTGLAPTPLALSLGPAAEAMESAAAHLVRSASAQPDVIGGTVRISTSEIIGVEVLPPMFASLRQAYPALCIELSLTNRIEDILRRDVDIAVRMTPPQQQEIVARRVGAVDLGLFVHAGLLARRAAPTSLHELKDWPLVGQDRRLDIINGLAAHGVDVGQDRFIFRCDFDVAQLAAIRAGVGIGVMQVPLAAHYPELVRVMPSIVSRLEMWTATHADLKSLPRVRAVLDHLNLALRGYCKAAPGQP